MDRSRGFSLIELMVAMVVSLVVILGAGQLFISLSQTSQRITLLSEKQAAVNFAVETLLRDIRRAEWGSDVVGEDGEKLTLRVRNRGDMTGCDDDGDRLDKRYSLGETASGESGSYSLRVQRRCVPEGGPPDSYGAAEPLIGGFDEGGFSVSWLEVAGVRIGVEVTLNLQPLQEGGDPDVLTFHAVNRTAAVTR